MFAQKTDYMYIHRKYTVNGLRLQANIASAVLTQIALECTSSVPKAYSIVPLPHGVRGGGQRHKQRHSMKSKRPCLQHWPNNKHVYRMN